MKVLIVEDETAAYENLTDILAEVAPISGSWPIQKVSRRLSDGCSQIRLRI